MRCHHGHSQLAQVCLGLPFQCLHSAHSLHAEARVFAALSLGNLWAASFVDPWEAKVCWPLRRAAERHIFLVQVIVRPDGVDTDCGGVWDSELGLARHFYSVSFGNATISKNHNESVWTVARWAVIAKCRV